jgi:hypothetical protein
MDVELQIHTDNYVFYVFFENVTDPDKNKFLDNVIKSIERSTSVDLSDAFDGYVTIGNFL